MHKQRPLASLIPNTAIAFVEFQSIEQLLDHPLRARIQDSPEFKKLWRSPEVLKMRGGITLAELALGDKLENIVRKLAGHGLVIAVDKQHEGIVLIARTESQEWLKDYMERLIKLARDDANSKDKKDPIKQGNYRGIDAYQTGGNVLAAVGEYLVVTNKGDLGKAVVDQYLDSIAANSIAQSPQLAAAVKAHDEGDAFAWGFVDVRSIREAGMAKKVFSGQSDNFVVELVLGGVLETLQHTPTVTASWLLSPNGIRLSFSAPHDHGSVDEVRQFFFGPESSGTALPLLLSEDTLASLSAYRDVSQMWLRAGDLFDERVNDQLAQADSTLTTLFSGRDFGEDILGALQPELRLVVHRQTFSSEQPTPALRLPSFALVGQLRDPQMMRPELKRTFQSLIGFLNVAGAMEGQPQLDLGSIVEGPQQFYTATYVSEIDRDASTPLPVQFNFTPTLAFVGDQVILSSSTLLARQIAEQLPVTRSSITNASLRERFASGQHSTGDRCGRRTSQPAG